MYIKRRTSHPFITRALSLVLFFFFKQFQWKIIDASFELWITNALFCFVCICFMFEFQMSSSKLWRDRRIYSERFRELIIILQSFYWKSFSKIPWNSKWFIHSNPFLSILNNIKFESDNLFWLHWTLTNFVYI